MDNKANNNELILTKEGKKKIEKKLSQLINVERPKVIKEIKIAREQGDLSENAEFDAARQKQGVIEDEIAKLEQILSDSEIIDTSNEQNNKNKDIVQIGSVVELRFNDETRTQKFTIVGSVEANPFKGLISNLSPLAVAILGRKVNDEVLLEKAIIKNKVKILKIQNI